MLGFFGLRRGHVASMVPVAALVSFGVGLVASWALFRHAKQTLRRTRPRAEWTWEDWRDADPLGGAWSPVVYTATFAAMLVGLYGFGAPGWARASLLGFLGGICLPAFTHGVYLKAKARRRDRNLMA